ncbi:MAG: NUDIX hydrolase [Pseudomonadota bacterium]
MTPHAPPPAVPAATILLLRDAAAGAGPALEVLMVERGAGLEFAGGALVFPGGRIDPADGDPVWAERALGLDDDAALNAARVAAAREAFEEVGVLLATKDGAPVSGALAAKLGAARAAVEADAALFAPLLAEHGLRLDLRALTAFSRWVAPEVIPKRFDTHFFLAAAPADQTPSPDGSEACACLWMRPLDALANRSAGRRRVIFPTARNLELLSLSADVAAARSDAAARPIEPVHISVEVRDGQKVVTIPDHLGYPVTAEDFELAMRN